MIAHFFLLLNNIPLSGCTMVYVSICFYRFFVLCWSIIDLQCCVGFRCIAKWFSYTYTYIWASLVAQMLKNLPAMKKALGSIPGLGRSPGGGQGNPLQYSCLENPHGQRSLAGCIQSMGLQRVRHDCATKHTALIINVCLVSVMQQSNLKNGGFSLYLEVKSTKYHGKLQGDLWYQ